MNIQFLIWCTCKSMSEALVLESVNPQYDKGIPRKIQVQNMLCTNTALMSKQKQQQKQICTQHVLNLYFLGNSMNLSFCGLTDARMRASEKDLHVLKRVFRCNVLYLKLEALMDSIIDVIYGNLLS